MAMNYVIGSGPAGVACARALVMAGRNVTMIDAGLEIDSDADLIRSQLGKSEPEEWSSQELKAARGDIKADAQGMQEKLLFGSDFAYRGALQELGIVSKGIGQLGPSLAQGGFSNVWGAAVLPYSNQDMRGWPLKYEDFSSYYQTVFSYLPLAAQHDDLEGIFPLYSDRLHKLELSRQIKRILKSFDAAKSTLVKQGLYYGQSRLALAAEGRAGLRPGSNLGSASPCRYCGLCLNGCPYQLIYSTSETLNQLKQYSNFKYLSSIIVEQVQEEGDQVVISTRSLDRSKSIIFRGQAVFLAAGVLSSSKIVLNSMQAYERPIEMLVSEYFLLPLLSVWKTPQLETERLHTSAQLFLEYFDSAISEHSIHMQLYSYSHIFKLALEQMFSKVKPLLPILRSQVLSRMFAIQGYLHSDDSSKIELTLKRSSEQGSGNNELHVVGQKNLQSELKIKQLVSKLSRLLFGSGLLAARPLLKLGLPGEGRHVGATFPMSQNPGQFQSDRLGRPTGFKRLYLVDSSCFTNIPASTITLSVMANAERIAAEFVKHSS